MKNKFPQEALIYQCDEVEGEPVYAVAKELYEIPEDVDGQKVAVYTLNRAWKFRVHRELK